MIKTNSTPPKNENEDSNEINRIEFSASKC